MLGPILLTGATDGIGLAVAQRYQDRGEHLLLHGRRMINELDSALFNAENYCRADLMQSDAAEKIDDFLAERGIDQLGLYIANAGIGWVGAVDEQPEASIGELVKVNLEAPIAIAHQLLPRLRSASGQMVFISSVVSAIPCVDFAVYAATKSAIEGFARSLRIELAGAVHVQIIRPGPTSTGMHAKSGLQQADAARFAPATEVAAKIVRAIDRKHRATTIGIRSRLLRTIGRGLPALVDRIARRRER